MANTLSTKEVEHIAELARIGISKKEADALREDLGAILEYVDALQEVDVAGVEPIAHSTGLENKTRDDVANRGFSHSERLLDMAPHTHDGYVKVKKILKDSTD